MQRFKVVRQNCFLMVNAIAKAGTTGPKSRVVLLRCTGQ